MSSILIFLVAFGVRLLAWQDNRFEALKVQTAVTDGYRHAGRLLREGGIASFFSASSPLADTNHLGHPPGYSILMALASGVSGDVETTMQLLQIAADALAAVVVLLIAGALLTISIARIGGLLVALAPQFTYNSTLLLPDSISVLPLLLALYCLTGYCLTWRTKRTRLWLLIAAGALIGVSCWLRANAMLLAPFVALVFPLVFERGKRLRAALALVGGMLLVVAPLTVRNAIVYRHFVPVSLGAGQTLLEGIADYDQAGRFGIPATDMGIMRMEADAYGRPDYYGTLFNPDGVKRERLRIKRGFGIISSHPFWFAGVMLRRGAGMLRLERVRKISPEPPATHSAPPPATATTWSASPAEFLRDGTISAVDAKLSLTGDGQFFDITGDEAKSDDQFASAPIMVRRNTDYLLRLPVRIEQGRMTIKVVSAQRSEPYAEAIIEPQDWKTPAEQPLNLIQISFSSPADTEVRIIFANGGSPPVRPVVQVGRAELYTLGPTAFVWTRYPRLLINAVQKLFVTAVMLPLALCGLFLLIRRRQRLALALLLIVPAYYICVQSALHTEYRYVLAIHYFLFILVAAALQAILSAMWASPLKRALARRFIRRSPARPASTSEPDKFLSFAVIPAIYWRHNQARAGIDKEIERQTLKSD